MGANGRKPSRWWLRYGAGSLILSIVIAVALAAPGAASAATCSASINSLQGPLPGTVVAPHLRLVKSFGFGPSNCGALRIVGGSSSGGLWAWDNSNGLWASTDDGSTWTQTYTAAGYAQIENVLKLASGHLLILARDGGGAYHVLRSTDTGGTAFASTPVLDMPPHGSLLGSESWVETGGAIYIAEYGDADPPIKLWKSTDDGQTFSVVYERSDIRHFHSVQVDPYVAGRIWVCIGDNGQSPRIGYSDDGGHAFTFISQATYPESRAVTLMFAPDAVYWGTDAGDVPSALFRWDRTTGITTTVLGNLNGPYYYGFSYQGVHVQLSGVERPVEDAYIGDQYIHVLSGDSSGWSDTRSFLMREPSSPENSNAVILGNTDVDGQGRFWVNFWNLAGTQYSTSNLQLQIDPNASGAVEPAASTDGASTLSSSGATLNGRVNPNGSATSVHFEYGTTTAYGSQTATQSIGSGASAQAVTAALGSLSANTTYHYRLVATNGGGTTNGEDVTFTTLQPPLATTDPASGVSAAGATVNATVDPNGSETTVHFEYGTTTGYGSQTPDQSALVNLVPNPGFESGAGGWGTGGTNPSVFARSTGWSSAGSASARYTAAVPPSGYSEAQVDPYIPGIQAGAQYSERVDVNVLSLSAGQRVVLYLTWRNAAGDGLGKVQVASTTSLGVRTLSGTQTAPAGAVFAQVVVSVENGGAADLYFDDARLNVDAPSGPEAVSAALSALDPATTYHYRVVATSAGGTTNGADRTFTTGGGAPTPSATTDAATAVTETGATANGTVDPNGSPTTVHFEYGTTTGYGSQTPDRGALVNLVANPGFESGASGWGTGGTDPTVFARDTGWASAGSASARYTVTVPPGGYSEAQVDPYVTGIQAGAQYSEQVDVNVLSLSAGQRVALYLTWRNAAGDGLGKVQVASTTALGVHTLSGTQTAPAGAVFAQVVVSVENGGAADLYFDDARLGTGTAPGPVTMSAPLSGLAAGTTYHYRVVATSAGGTTNGADRTFTTDAGAPPPPPPSATTDPAGLVTQTGATLNATVNPNGSATDVRFEYGTTAAYGSQTAVQSLGAGATGQAVAAALTTLSPGTTYHYRVVASSPAGTTNGEDRTFTTAAQPPPTATTDPATAIAATGATLNATVNPNGSATDVRFQYGTTTAYGSQTAVQSLGAGTAAQAVTDVLAGLAPSTTYHFRVVATSPGGTTNGADRTFTTPALPPPTATTDLATAVTQVGATLNGTVNPNGSATTVRFQYGTTTSYGSLTAVQSLGSGTAALAVTAALTGLAPNTTYHYRVVATSSRGTTNGVDATFKTLPLPTVTTNAATAIAATGATLNGSVNPNGSDTTVRFQYGTTASYGSLTAVQSLGAGTAAQAVSAALTGLAPSTTYHFRVVATSGAGTTNGADRTFTTPALPPPSATTDPATAIAASGATLHGTVNPNGLSTTARFQYGTSTSYGSLTATQSLGAGTTALAVSASVTGLLPSTTYHFRVVATSSRGTTNGADRTFTTAAAPNLVPNSSFETNVSGWSTAGTALTSLQRSTSWASAGVASARLTTLVGTGGYGEARVDPAIAGIDDGARYTASAAINVASRSSGQRVTLYVLWRNFAGTQLGKVQAATTTATGARTLTGTLTAPTGTVSAQVAVTVENGGIADVYFDDVRLKLGNVALSATPSGAPDAPLRFGTVFGVGRTLTDRPVPTIVVGGSVGASGVLPVSVECVAPSVTTCGGALRVRAANAATTGARRTFRVRRPGSLSLRIKLPSAVVRRLASAPRGSAVAVEVILTDTGGATAQVTRRVVYLRR